MKIKHSIQKIAILGCSLICVVTLFSACKHQPSMPVTIVDTTGGGIDTSLNNYNIDSLHINLNHPCSSDSVYFANDIFPLIVSSCTDSVHGCHYAGYRQDGGPLVSYQQIMKDVNITNPTKSKLYTVLKANGESKMPRSPFEVLTDSQMNLILKWIQQGAKNNFCGGDCDTGTAKFSTVIFPIIKASCIGCHTTSNPSGDISLSSYSDIKLQVDNGKLLGAIFRVDGYYFMPPTATLSDCEIALITTWVKAGAANN